MIMKYLLVGALAGANLTTAQKMMRRTSEFAVESDGSMSMAAGIEGYLYDGSAPASKSGKSGKMCSIESLEGKYKFEYDFYSSEAGAYIFPDSESALTITKPSGGSGVMLVNDCFRNDNTNPYVAVQTGFAKNGIIPVKFARFEPEKNDIYNKAWFTGEYDCGTETLLVGRTAFFEGTAFAPKPSVKDNDLELNEFGCLA